MELANEIDRAYVDPELERGGRDYRLELAALEALLREQALSAGEAAMVGHHTVGAESFLQIQCDSLGGAAAQGEDQGGAMLADESRNFVVHRVPMFMRRERTQVRTGCNDFEIHGANAIVGTDNFHRTPTRRASAVGVSIDIVAGQELRELLDWIKRRGETDTIRPWLSATGDESLEPLQREGQMRAALVAGERMKFVDDNVADRGECLAEFRRGQQDEERFRGGEDKVRRPLGPPRKAACRGCAGANPGRQIRRGHIKEISL